nr:hypothetical protein [Tanacetum cinerariifolium]
MAIDGVGWDWSYMANEEDHALVADGEAPTEFSLMANIENKETPKKSQVKYAEQYKHSNKRPKGNQRNWNNLKSHQLGPEFVLHKKTCFNCGDFSHLANDCRRRVQRETTRSQKYAYESPSHRYDGHRPHGAPMRPPLRSSGHRPHGGSMRPPHRSAGHRPHGPSMNPRRPIMNVKTPYRAPWVPTINRPSPTVVSTSAEGQNKDSSTTEDVASPNSPKPFVKFVKPKDSQPESKSKEKETPKKLQVKYAEQYRHSNKRPKGNQRNWNNLKSYQLGPEFVLHKKPCFNCGDFSHLANDCRRRVQRETNRSQNHPYKSSSHRSGDNRPYGAPMRPPLRSSSYRPHRGSMRPSHRSAGHRPHGPSMNPRRPTMNGARPYKSFFIQLHSYETRPFLKSSVVKNPYRAPWVPTINRYDPPVNRKFSTGRRNFPTANRKFPTASRKFTTGSTKNHTADVGRKGKAGSSQNNIDDKGYWDSGCSRHMTGNISYLSDFKPFDGGYVSFGQGGCKITGKGTIKTGKLKFENVYFVKDLKYNLFSVSQICDNKNSVLFTDSKCIVLGRNFKLLDYTNILLRTPRQHNMYSIDLNNIVPLKDLTCLVAKASGDECILWHMRLGHLNVKTMNKLVRHNLVRGLPTKSFDNDHTCTAYLKGKQHKASCKSKSKDETSDILKKFITEIENLKDYKVKIIRRNRTLIEAARTMLADAKLPVTFWVEVVNTACYVQNRVLVNKSQNKTPYNLFNGRTPAIGFFKPFGYHVMILNTLDNLGKFKAKGDEGYFIGYSMSSKAFRVFNKRTRRAHYALLESTSSKPYEESSTQVP